jgi:hypothetical protein
MGQIDLLNVFTQNYGSVLGSGFTREQLESHLPENKRNALDPWIMPCVNDQSMLQPRAINIEIFKQAAAPSGLTDVELQNVWNVFQNTMSNARPLIDSVAPEAESVFQKWRSTSLKSLTLTSVGIAIGHANATRIIGLGAPLNIWIK